MVYKPKVRHCKDCPPTGTRAATHPGPRCATHWREYLKRSKARSHELMVTKTYGIEAGEYERRYKEQGGKCAICAWATGASKRLSVDHNHRTGAVRGLLCGPCNRFIGRIGDSPEAALRMYKYLGGKSEYINSRMTKEQAKEFINDIT